MFAGSQYSNESAFLKHHELVSWKKCLIKVQYDLLKLKKIPIFRLHHLIVALQETSGLSFRCLTFMDSLAHLQEMLFDFRLIFCAMLKIFDLKFAMQIKLHYFNFY